MSLECQVIGLAAVFQGVRLALDLARDGRCDEDAEAVCLASVLALETDSARDLYGGVAGVRRGLRELVAELDCDGRDLTVTRAVATVLHLERKLARRAAMLAAIRAGVRETQRAAESLGPAHPAVKGALAELYHGTLSTLTPRVMVQGNCLHLTKADTVARIRALLLAAVRGAVLWRQMGGSSWRFVLQRRKIAAAARTLLARGSCRAA